jgi:hypothetical protein
MHDGGSTPIRRTLSSEAEDNLKPRFEKGYRRRFSRTLPSDSPDRSHAGTLSTPYPIDDENPSR